MNKENIEFTKDVNDYLKVMIETIDNCERNLSIRGLNIICERLFKINKDLREYILNEKDKIEDGIMYDYEEMQDSIDMKISFIYDGNINNTQLIKKIKNLKNYLLEFKNKYNEDENYKLFMESVTNGYILDTKENEIVSLVSTLRPDLEFKKLRVLINKANDYEEFYDKVDELLLNITNQFEAEINSEQIEMMDELLEDIREYMRENRE